MLPERSTQELDLIAELLEARRISQDFPSPAGRIRVETRIRISRTPWTFRSAILREGVEVQKRPFAPVEERDKSVPPDPEDLDEARQEFASRALEHHQRRCREVKGALAEGGSVLTERTGTLGGPGFRKGMIGASVALGIAGLAAGGIYLWTRNPHTAAPPAAQGRPAVVQSPVQAAPGSSDKAVAPAPQPAPVQAGQTRTPTTPGSPLPQPSRNSPPTPQPREAASASAETTRSVRESKPAAPKSVVSDIDPSRYRTGRLRVGEMVYVDTDASFAEVPQAYEGLRCIRTANEDRILESSLAFDLAQSARVYVAHDRRISKKPKWLKSEFSPTSERLTLNGPLGSAAYEMDLFVQERPPGRVVLGPNTEWSSLTKAFRSKVPKDLTMYIVCVSPQ